MYQITKTNIFETWLDKLKDRRAASKINARLRNIELGNLGRTKSLGAGLHEIKIDYAVGYRLYFTNQNQQIIIMICGGDKSTQQRDIELAKEIMKQMKAEKLI